VPATSKAPLQTTHSVGHAGVHSISPKRFIRLAYFLGSSTEGFNKYVPCVLCPGIKWNAVCRTWWAPLLHGICLTLDEMDDKQDDGFSVDTSFIFIWFDLCGRVQTCKCKGIAHGSQHVMWQLTFYAHVVELWVFCRWGIKFNQFFSVTNKWNSKKHISLEIFQLIIRGPYIYILF